MMKIERKELQIENISNLTTEYIENKIKQAFGFYPLRWAITKVENDLLYLEIAIQSR